MEKRGALSGIRVIDMTRVLAGPYCGMMLGDLGAEVIKVEKSGTGDDSRANYPFVNEESAYYFNLNRNKRGITLNLKTEEGKQILKDLVKDADILIENFRPGVMNRLGLGFEELRKVNPKLVYGAVSGFGQYGPYKDRPGYDIIGQAMGGMMSTTGWPQTGPTRSGTAIADVMGGISLTVGILAAYISAQKTGQGQLVDVALVDSIVSSLETISMIYIFTGRIPGPIGNRYEPTYPYDVFNAKDGQVALAAGNDRMFGRFITAMNKTQILEDERFCKNLKRVENHAALREIVQDWIKDLTVNEIVDLMLKNSVPAGPVLNLKQITEDPHIAGAREMFVEMEHPKAGKIKVTGNQIKLSETPVQFNRPAPTLGQHTKEICCSVLGMSEETYNEYLEKGIF